MVVSFVEGLQKELDNQLMSSKMRCKMDTGDERGIVSMRCWLVSGEPPFWVI